MKMLENELFAKYYDFIYSGLDRSLVTGKILDSYDSYCESGGMDFLDVACGTGLNVEHLNSRFDCYGVDLNEEMLIEARRKFPSVDFTQGDMRYFSLNKKFDLLTCSFNSMNYLSGYSDFGLAIQNFYDHLRTGGVFNFDLICEESFPGNEVTQMRTYDSAELKVARMSKFRRGSSGFLTCDTHYMVLDKWKDFVFAEDSMMLKIFSREKILDAVEKVGFLVKDICESGTGGLLFSGIKAR